MKEHSSAIGETRLTKSGMEVTERDETNAAIAPTTLPSIP